MFEWLYCRSQGRCRENLTCCRRSHYLGRWTKSINRQDTVWCSESQFPDVIWIKDLPRRWLYPILLAYSHHHHSWPIVIHPMWSNWLLLLPLYWNKIKIIHDLKDLWYHAMLVSHMNTRKVDIPALDRVPEELVQSPGCPPAENIQIPGVVQDGSLRVKDLPYQPKPSVTFSGATPARQSRSRPSGISVRFVCGRM